MRQIKFYLGLNDKDTHEQEITTIKAIKKIVAAFKEHGIDGFTIYKANGMYQGEIENTLIIEVLTEYLGEAKIKEICRYLALIFNQNEVIASDRYIYLTSSKNEV